MTKSTVSTVSTVVAGKAARKASKAPSKAVVVQATPAAPAPAAASPAPVAAVVAPIVQAVALRGGMAIVAIAPGKPYRVAAGHNKAWYDQVCAAWAAGPAPVGDLVKAGIPSPFIGYMVRRGYAKSA